MIETVLIKLTEAIEANTAALIALKGEGATVTPTPAAKAAPATKAAPAPKAEKPAPAPKKEDPAKVREALRKHIFDERARLTEQVSPAASAKHKELTRVIVGEAGGTSITDIPEAKLDEVFAAIKAIDVNASNNAADDDEDL